MARGGPPEWLSRAPATWFFVAVNLGVYLLMLSRYDWNMDRAASPEALLLFGALSRDAIWGGEWWRFASAMCIHIGPIHLFWNCYCLPGWCIAAEQTVGSGRFAFAYVTSGLGASAISVLGHNALAAGASGAGFGIIGLTLALHYSRWESFEKFINLREVQSILMTAAIWTVIGFAVFNMDHYAHFGGLGFGILCGLVLNWTPLRRGGMRFASPAVYLALLAATLVAASWPGEQEQARRLHNEALPYLARGELDRAIEILDEVESTGYRSRELYFNRALAWEEKGELDRAEQDYTSSLELDGDYLDARRRRGQLRARRGDRDGAIRDLEAYLKRAPEHWPERLGVVQTLESLRADDEETPD